MGTIPPTLDPQDPRFRLLCLWTGASHWLRRADEWARVGTPEADQVALALRCRAAFHIYTWPGDLEAEVGK